MTALPIRADPRPRRLGPPRGVTVAAGARVGRGVRWAVAPGASVAIGPRAVLEDGCVVQAGPAARVRLDGVVRATARVVAAQEVALEAGAELQAEALVTDASPQLADPERPVQEQGVATRATRVGAGARIGTGAAVLPGVAVGAGADVLPRSTVTSDVGPGVRVGGTPARPLS